MELREALDIVKSDKEYKRITGEGAFLFSCFSSSKGASRDFSEWQFGFLLNDGRALTFFVEGSRVRTTHTSEIFRSGKKILPLDVNGCAVPLNEALDLVEEKANKLPFSTVTTMVILQILNKEPVWNITMISKEFSILNFKINAKDKKVISSNIRSVFDFKG